MPRTSTRAAPLAQQLLDAQVAYHLDRLTGDELASTMAALTDDLLTAGDHHQMEDLIDREAIKAIVVRSLKTVPASAAVSGIVELATTIVYDGPDAPYPLGELVTRDQVEPLLDSLLALHPVLDRFVDGLADVPLVGTTASRFMGRVVGEVLGANKAMADKVPGLGSLMSMGSNAASRVMGAADKQLDGFVADTMGKSGSYAVRRLNRIVIETLRDPTTREAALQAWDLLAREQVVGLSSYASHEQVFGVADALHDAAIAALATDHVARLAEVVVDGFFDRFGGYTPSELLDELDLSREDLVADVVRLAPTIADVLRESGDLERLLRAQLEPFYASPQVRDLLG